MTTATRPVDCPPLYGTPRTDRPTWGPAVAEIARRLGKPPMPHQAAIFDIAFEVDPATGLLAYSEVVVIGPRQATGKTELLLPVMTHRCVGFDQIVDWSRHELGLMVPPAGPQRVLYTAQTADDARKKWRDVHLERLKVSRYRRDFHARLGQNMEAFLWRNGSMWSPGSTTGKTGGTGDTLDLGVIDEAWSRPDARTELGMRPAMMTRPWSQIWITSMIPGATRSPAGSWKFLEAKRRAGRERVEYGITTGTAFFDFSAPPGSDPGDPRTWESCLPGLHRTVSERKVREDFEAMGRVDFEAEYLGWEPPKTKRLAEWRVVPEATWLRQCDPESQILQAPGARPRVAFAIDVDPVTAVGTIGVCGLRADGRDHVEVVERHRGSTWIADAAAAGAGRPISSRPLAEHERAAVDRMAEFATRYEVVAVAVLRTSEASALIAALAAAGLKVRPVSQEEYAQACGAFVGALDDGTAVHIGQTSATDAVGNADKRQGIEGNWRWSRETGVDAAPAVVFSLALWVRRNMPTVPRSKAW